MLTEIIPSTSWEAAKTLWTALNISATAVIKQPTLETQVNALFLPPAPKQVPQFQFDWFLFSDKPHADTETVNGPVLLQCSDTKEAWKPQFELNIFTQTHRKWVGLELVDGNRYQLLA